MARTMWQITLENPYTKEAIFLTSSNEFLLNEKIRKKQAQWEKEDGQRKVKEYKENLNNAAKIKDSETKNEISRYENLLQHTLGVDDVVDWDKLKNFSSFAIYTTEKEPQKTSFFHKVPKESFLEKLPLFGSILKERRENALKKAQDSYEDQLKNYNHSEQQRLETYQKERLAFENKQREYNEGIDSLKSKYESISQEGYRNI